MIDRVELTELPVLSLTVKGTSVRPGVEFVAGTIVAESVIAPENWPILVRVTVAWAFPPLGMERKLGSTCIEKSRG